MKALSLVAGALVAASALSGCHTAPESRAPVLTPSSPSPKTSEARPQIDLPTAKLTPFSSRTQSAIRLLASTREFGGSAVGVAGLPTPQVVALRELIAAPHAKEALEVVLEHGTVEAQLMALSGLFYADPVGQRERVERFAASEATAAVRHGGCMVGTRDVLVATLVRASGAVRLNGPEDTIYEWGKRQPKGTSIVLDIAGGGYPSMLRGRADDAG